MAIRLTPALAPGGVPTDENRPCPRCPGRHTNICQPLEPRALAAFFDGCMRQRWARHEFLFRSGDPLGSVFKLTAGIAAVAKPLPSGERQILRFLMPGDVCGYLSDDGHYSFDGVAISEEVVTCSFPREHFDGFVARNDAMGVAVRLELSAVLKEVSQHMTAMGQLPSTARVANFLCTMRAAFAAHGMESRTLDLPMTRTDIGDYLGLRIETVSRAFTTLRRRRLIALDGETVTILDPAGLAAAARRAA
jgi:CRP/FNR family transcriptional regulator